MWAPVDVGVGHDDDLVVAQLGDVEVVAADPVPRHWMIVRISWFATILSKRAFSDVEDLAAQRQDRLEAPVRDPASPSRPPSLLDQEQLANAGSCSWQFGELAGQVGVLERTLAPRQLARLAGGLAARAASTHFETMRRAQVGFSSKNSPSLLLTTSRPTP